MDSLSNMWDSLMSRTGDIIPKLLAAILILIIGSFIAGIIRRLIKRLLTKSGIDTKLDPKGKSNFSVAKTISNLVYYLIMIYVLVLVLSTAGITGALEPLQNMLNEVLTYLPNIIGAGIIAYAGYMLGRIAAEAAGLITPAIDRLSERMGLNSSINLTSLIQQIVFIFVFVPLLLQAFRYLNMDLISEPATEMLGQMMNAIPRILAAAIVITVFYIGGKYVSSIISELLNNMGANQMAQNLGISSMISSSTSFSSLVGSIVFFFLMFAGIMTAVEQLQFEQLTEIMQYLFSLSGKILFGMVILVAGNQISKWAYSIISQTESPGVASIARYGILGLFIAISLSSIGVASEIVDSAFILILGAVAVAIALAYGLGGREAAGEHFKEIINKLKK